jgi:hypothetical protein
MDTVGKARQLAKLHFKNVHWFFLSLLDFGRHQPHGKKLAPLIAFSSGSFSAVGA